MNLKEESVYSTTKYTSKIFDLEHHIVRLPNGQESTRDVIKHNGGVVIIPLLSDKELVLIRQFRYAMQEELIEFPAGRLEKGEDPQEAGSRELKEETGYTAGSLEYLGQVYPAPGFCTEVLYYYLATNLVKGDTNFDDDEFLEPIVYSLDELQQAIKENKIKDAKTVVGFNFLLNKIKS